MKRYQVIVNPAAGRGNGLKAIPAIESLLKQHGLEYQLDRTERPGHAIELSAKAIDSCCQVLVAAGGDGTVNEVVNALMLAKLAGKPIPVLAVLCVGRGNDFAGSVGIPETLEGGCQALVSDQRRMVDIGRVVGGIYPQGRFFANCVGIGFDTIATLEVMKLPRWGGFLSFLTAVLKTIFLYNHAPMATIEYGDQKIVQRSLLISMMNGRRLGGGFYMAPNSRPDDGLLDLCIARQMSSFRVLQMIPLFMKGTQFTQPEIRAGQTTRISITAQDGPLPAQTDGEIICTDGSSIEVELLPRQLEIIYQPA